MSQLKPGESLGIYLDRYIFNQIADVTDPAEFKDFFEQVEGGRVRLLGFFAIPSDRFG